MARSKSKEMRVTVIGVWDTAHSEAYQEYIIRSFEDKVQKVREVQTDSNSNGLQEVHEDPT